MKVAHIRRNPKKQRGPMFVVEMDQYEACQLIASLAKQVQSGSPNTGRVESRTANGEYFSIAVVTDHKSKPFTDNKIW